MHNISDLPIHQHRTQILNSINNNRVLVISGRTGCGKSTQVPKYILSEFPNAMIAVCQPRRLAATSLAIRVAEELECKVGALVGYQIGMESKISEKTRVVYMTYGILIQQLLFNSKIEYTHIVLDEVHERSLEMDFTFIALKKILDGQADRNVKVVIMSATINSSQFCKYFATHNQTQDFAKPVIVYSEEKKSRRGRGSSKIEEDKLQMTVDVKFNHENYSDAKSIILPDKALYKVTETFADEIENNQTIPEYYPNQDVRIRDETYRLAIRLIEEHLKRDEGDVLIFVPGMFEIKALKDLLVDGGMATAEQIVEVHSAYSEELYKRLFKDKVKNKVIIATNIGESSITLPFCKTVIDFCLTRKNISVKVKGYSRFETRVASKANLMQRSGRVGRISDGRVYRLIKRGFYAELDDFDIPEIKCVSLDMVILKAKQIDKTNNSIMFQDPYQVIYNAIQPPKYQQIHQAIEYLLKQGALVLINSNREQVTKFNGCDLKLTRVGEFMVEMPCDIRISKMILRSLEMGIVSTITDIASILLSQKSFFQHEDKRYSIEQWMHSMVGYDRGYYNDFLLRQRLFHHWRSNFFEPFLHRGYKYRQKGLPEAKFRERILEQFNNNRINQQQWNWCDDRGVSPHVMRDILRINENIRERLHKSVGIPYNYSKEETFNDLVILCLCIAFENTSCSIEWINRNYYKNIKDVKNFVSLIESDVTTEENLYNFFQPSPMPELTYEKGGFIRIEGSNEIISKLLLPKNYNKANLQNTSQLYKYLAGNPPKTTYTYEQAIVRQTARDVTILNDSINKTLIRPDHTQEYMLVSDKIFDSKSKYFMGACALIERKKMIIIRMMTAKSVYLEPHPSYEFYSRVIINDDEMELPFLLTDADIHDINQFRKFSQEDQSKKLEQGNLIGPANRAKYLRLLEKMTPKPKMQQWCYVFDQAVQKYKNAHEKPIEIGQAKMLKQVNSGGGYFQRYRKWKQTERRQLYFKFRELTIKAASLICSKCWPSELTVVQGLDSFCPEKQILKLNEYRGSWVAHNSDLLCSRKHRIGTILNPDEGELIFENLLMYCPKGVVADFNGKPQAINQISSRVKEGIEQIEKQKSQIEEFECKICSDYDEYDRNQRCILSKYQEQLDTSKFWKKISDHMYSKKHLDNLSRFNSC